MAWGIPVDAVKTAICVVGLSYNILSAITAMRLIQLRACLHVVNRNLPTTLLGLACLVIATNSGLVRAWSLLASRTDVYAGVQRMQLLGIGLCMTVLPAMACSRLHVVVVKFREAGGSLDDQGWTAKLLRVLLPDIRTRKGHFKYMAGVVCVAMVAWAMLLEYGHYLCIRICKEELPVYGAPWLFVFIPSFASVIAVSRSLMELSRLGAVEEGLGFLEELRYTVTYGGGAGCTACLVIMLMDFGLLSRSWEPVAHMSWLVCEFSFLYINFIRLAWPSGYQPCLFCLPCAHNPKRPSSSSTTATSKVTPLLPPTGPASPRRPLLVKGQESSRRLLTSARDRLGDTMPLPADTEQVADMSVLLAMLQGVADDQPCLEEVYRTARHLLSEEAVRCAVAIARAHLFDMSIKANRPQLRGCWRAIVEAHLREGARSPVSINEQMRWAICHQIERACRRQVLFLDDCETVNRMLVDQLLRELSPIVEPALATFLAGRSQPSKELEELKKPEATERPKEGMAETVTNALTTRPFVGTSGQLEAGHSPRVNGAWSDAPVFHDGPPSARAKSSPTTKASEGMDKNGHASGKWTTGEEQGQAPASARLPPLEDIQDLTGSTL